MSQLSDRSIEKLCRERKWLGLRKQVPMIQPFVADKRLVRGKSYGLSACTYDVRIERDLTLGFIGQKPPMVSGEPAYPWYALANTIEDFYMPANVAAYVVDKSTFARVFVSAFNTLMDPGFQGNLTLELVNLSEEPVAYRAGDPVCQIAFQWLDRPARKPYAGKYQHQSHAPHEARYELSDGTHIEAGVADRFGYTTSRTPLEAGLPAPMTREAALRYADSLDPDQP